MKRFWIRGICFLAAMLAALGLIPGYPADRIFLGLSPLLGGLGALASWRTTPWLLLGLPVVVLGLFTSRWFCRYVCPVGFATEIAGGPNRRNRGAFARWPNLGRWLFWLLLGSAAAGYPLFIWLDPLSIFNGFFSGWRAPATWAAMAGFPLVLLLSLAVPQAWCQRICPLGAFQDVLSALRRGWLRRKTENPPPAGEPVFGRREFLGVVAGGAAALALRRFAPGKKHPPIRPPGARPEEEFTALCARCGACIRACPYKVLRPDVGEGGVTGLLAPTLDYAKAHCFEYCNECTKVCPTGAIERLALEVKRNRAMGLAEIDRGTCLAWRHRQYCMVCHEFCPYLAIDSVEQNGVPCPVVKPEMCRGCGACQVDCPALPDKAIVVQGTPQHGVRPLPEAGGFTDEAGG